jgi:hypothetical protein
MLLTIFGCGGPEVQVAEEDVSTVEETPVAPVSDMIDFKFHTLVANIPSPLVTYELLRESGVPYYKNLSNPLENRGKYQVESSKAMNFGVYMADFGYALLNEDNQKALKYYAASHNLAKDLGFGPVLDQVVNERLIANVGNSDSAKVIINDTYKAIDRYLRSNDQQKTASYIITGGWMQTQYIVLGMIDDTQSGDILEHLRKEVYKQQMHIGNLITFLIEYQGDADVASLIEHLATVKGAYDRLVDVGDVDGEKKENLKSAINSMRTKITS